MVAQSGYAARFNESRVRAMGRDTSGVKGMNVAAKGNEVLEMDVARDDAELFVVTENGFGKRTAIPEYPVKGRGTKGVKTIQLTDRKGKLAGALVVKEHQELLFISQSGMVQRTGVRGISKMGRSTQGVKVMNVRDDFVSAVALVVESDADVGATVTTDDGATLDGASPNGSNPERDRDGEEDQDPNGSEANGSATLRPAAGTAARRSARPAPPPG